MAEPPPSIANFPLELLGKIFSFLHSCNQEPFGPYRRVPSWLAVTHVCRRWRAASLCHANLWTDIITRPISSTEESLARSGSAAIDLGIHWFSTEPLPEVLTIALSHYPRAKVFRLTAVNVSPYLSMIPAREAPYLKHLHLEGEIESPPSLADVDFLYENMPKLRSVALHDCIIPWSLWSPGGIFQQNLRVLFISLSPALPRASAAELHACLSSLPLLEYLDLSDVLSRDDDALDIVLTAALRKTSPSPILHLPNLQKLDLRGAYSFSTSLFLYRLRTPPTTEMEITYVNGADAVNVSPLSPIGLSVSLIHLLNTMRSQVQDSLLCMTVGESLEDRDVRWSILFAAVPAASLPLDIGSEVISQGLFDDLKIPSIRVRFEPRIPGDMQGIATFERVFLHSAIPTGAAGWPTAIACVACPLFANWELWWNVFASMTPSHLLRVDGNAAAAGLVEALDMDSGPPSEVVPAGEFWQEATEYWWTFSAATVSNEPFRYLFSSLRWLLFVRVDFTDQDAAVLMRLKSALVRRREAGADEVVPLERLDILRCVIKAEQVDELKGCYASEVVWDGREEGEYVWETDAEIEDEEG